MALNKVDIVRAKSARVIGCTHRPDLPLNGWRDQCLLPPIIGQTNPPDHAQNSAIRPNGVLKALKRKDGATIRGHKPIRRLVEWKGISRSAQCIQGRKTHVQKQIIRATQTASNHLIRLSIM